MLNKIKTRQTKAFTIDDLSKEQLISLFSVTRAVREESGLSFLMNFGGVLKELLGITALFFAHIDRSVKNKNPGITLRHFGVSDEWAKIYTSCGYALIDPILLQTISRASSVDYGRNKESITFWEETYNFEIRKIIESTNLPISVKERKLTELRKFMNHAEQYGLVQGVTSGNLGSNGTACASLISMIWNHKKVSPAAIYMASLILPFMNDKIPESDMWHIPNLSAKNIDIMRWFSQGLSAAEVAKKMNLSIDGVNHHTRSIFKKLNVDNIRSAVFRFNNYNFSVSTEKLQDETVEHKTIKIQTPEENQGGLDGKAWVKEIYSDPSFFKRMNSNKEKYVG